MSRLPARRPMPEGYVEFGAESADLGQIALFPRDSMNTCARP